MPPAKKKAPKQHSSGGSDDEDYRKKRDRNNQAVKRSRNKSKQKASQTKTQVDNLKTENEKLEEAILQKEGHLSTLKDLFLRMATAKSDSHNQSNLNLQELLAESDEGDAPSGAK